MIRKATIDDYKALANIHILGWQSAYRDLLPDEFLDSLSHTDREKKWKNWLEKDLLNVYVYVENDTVLGYINIKQKESLVEWMGFYLLPQVKKRGLGSALLNFVESEIKPSKIVLYVLEGNDSAIQFYKKHGFKFTNEDQFLEIQGKKYKEFSMAKIIS